MSDGVLLTGATGFVGMEVFGADHPYARRVVAVRGDITRPGRRVECDQRR
jgi:hypothetical protein